MRKNSVLSVALIVLLAVLMPASFPSRSENRPNDVPPMPFPVVGIVKFNGFYLSTNGVVMAHCVDYSQGPALIEIDQDGKSWYAIEISGDDPATIDEKEGCIVDETITFTIQGETADETTEWKVVTESFRHDISFGSPNMVFLPLIRR